MRYSQFSSGLQGPKSVSSTAVAALPGAWGSRALIRGPSSPSSIFPLSLFPYLTGGYLDKHLSKSLDFSAGQCRA